MQNTLTREQSPVRDLTLVSVLALLCVLAWDFSGMDDLVMHALGDQHGFALKTNWWLEQVLHTNARQLSGLVLVLLALMVWRPLGWFRDLSRLQRVEIVAGVLWAMLCVTILKRISLTSCPWDLQDFGGPAVYVSHWRWGLADGGAGHCFPGGHASSALAYLALCLPWLTNATVAARRRGRALLVGVLVLGFILGMTQTLRGAHYPSHTLWTGLICWLVAMLNHLAFDVLFHRRATKS